MPKGRRKKNREAATVSNAKMSDDEFSDCSSGEEEGEPFEGPVESHTVNPPNLAVMADRAKPRDEATADGILIVTEPYEKECLALEAIGRAKEHEQIWTYEGTPRPHAPGVFDFISRSALWHNEKVQDNMESVKNLIRASKSALAACSRIAAIMVDSEDSSDRAVGITYARSRERLRDGLKGLGPALVKIRDSRYKADPRKQDFIDEAIRLLN